MERDPDIEEVLVERVKAFRFAERDGTSDKIFTEFNGRAARAAGL